MGTASTPTLSNKLVANLDDLLSEDWIRHGNLYEVFSVLDTLAAYDTASVKGTWLAHAMQRLIACEQQPGGPYFSTSDRLEPAANAAIAAFLTHFDVELPQLQQYLAGVQDVPPAKVAFSAPVRRVLKNIRALQAAAAQSAVAPAADTDALQSTILQQAKDYMQALPAPLSETGLRVWDEMRRADRNHEIVLMPQMFAEMLHDQSGIANDQLRLLGLANFFCWIATVLYDDFIDEEGDPVRLPISNVAHRASLDYYRQALTKNPELYGYVEHMYALVDRANAWEVTHTRATAAKGRIQLPALPDYGDRIVLADRAFGHAIGPMLLVQQLPDVQMKPVKHVQAALKQYLIARQLNDDIHDWRKDLAVGQLNAVVVELLKGAGVQPGTYSLKTLVPRLEKHFMQGGLATLCAQLIDHITRCRQALAASKLTKPQGGFMLLVDDLEASANAALRIQGERRAFLDAYQQLAPRT